MPFTLEELAAATNSQLVGDPSYVISGVETLEGALPHDASFLSNPLYNKYLKTSKAGVVFVDPYTTLLEGKNFLVSEDPSLAFQKVIDLIFPREPNEGGFEGVHPSAVIHQEAKLAPSVTVGPLAVIEKGAVVGANSYIGASTFIGAHTAVGENCELHPNVTIKERCQLGDRVVIQSGAVIGSSGFGYATTKEGKHLALRQVGTVVIEDDVEIGANTTIDRGRFKTTLVKRGTKIDNLVQIAHQVEVGEDNLIVSQVGIAGSSKTGRNVVLAGQVGVIGHITIADGTILAARAAPIKSIREGGIYSGVPATPIREYHEHMVHFRKLKKYAATLKELSKRVTDLETNEKSPH